jgi:superfamily II DNA or RNA helicase/diadenosine tetraphosphate (Ap4A) HIT family hydrolase/HKD family nuclease
MPESPFLLIAEDDWVGSNELAFAVRDRFPVSPGHTLVVPRRHIASWWQATPAERAALLDLVEEVKHALDDDRRPDGYNIGFNDGAAAGQTVGHLHVHVIPRYAGDMADPRGGVRHVIPAKGNYVAPTSVDLFEGQDRVLYPELVRRLRDPAIDRVDVVVSFIMKSGLAMLTPALRDALDREAHVRMLTTDYLGVTDADALARLSDLADGLDRGRLETRIFHDDRTSFHPKAYLFWSGAGGPAAAYVGSNNLSRSGIADGVEWAVGLDRVAPMLEAFERLWRDLRTVPLTRAWLASYRLRQPPSTVVPIGIEIEPPAQPAAPRPLQREVLDALERTRLDGHAAGLVVLATGLGKTWVAAFDSARPEFRRILFVAHREEILRQSRDVFRRVQPDADLGMLTGAEKDPGARIVFASVQTLVRRLADFRPDEFDYVVVDEFHHAAAASYRQVIDHFSPRFLLGLTATPDRMDGADLLALCGDNLVFECGLVDGVRRGDLCTFEYHGIKDITDFAPIPWRNGRFDPQRLAAAVETVERAQQAFDEWSERRGARTLAFCVSRTHADFMATFFAERGVRAVSVHSGPGSAPRTEAIERLRDGELDVVFAVDIFNEGLDVPSIDTVLLLRPTDSPVVFLQQLGRGLRVAADKAHLVVIDVIGNHRSFLTRPRTLLSLVGPAPFRSDAQMLDAVRAGAFELPAGCSVHYDLEVIAMLAALIRRSADDTLIDAVKAFAEDYGHRPTAVQAWRMGLNMTLVRSRFGSWFDLLRQAGLLGDDEAAVVAQHGDTLAGLELEKLTKSYKLVTLRALIQMDALRRGAAIARIAAASRRIVTGDPRLVDDARGRTLPDPVHASPAAWERHWRKDPIEALGGGRRADASALFQIAGDALVPRFEVPDMLGPTFDSMVAEVVEYRLARHLLERSAAPTGNAMTLKVNHAGGRPIIMLDRHKHPGLPSGDVQFEADGQRYVGRFVKVAVNVARKSGDDANALHDPLRSWFGERAGLPGTQHRVVLEKESATWRLRAAGDDAASASG